MLLLALVALLQLLVFFLNHLGVLDSVGVWTFYDLTVAGRTASIVVHQFK